MPDADRAVDDLAVTTSTPAWLTRPVPLLILPIMLGVAAYSLGISVGFVSDDYGWLRRGVAGGLDWNVSFQVANHFNALPLEIALYHLKFVLFGFTATGYHLFSLAGHICNVLLVYLLAGRLGLGRPIAYLGTVLAAVMAVGAQAVYWISGDPHVWATVPTLAAVILYIDYRRKGGRLRYAAAIALAAAAPLIKAEGVAVIGGVLAYELILQRPLQLTWKFVPFVFAPIPFVWWEWTTQDQLKSYRAFGLNVVTSGLDYLKQTLLPMDPAPFFTTTGGRLHPTLVAVGLALSFEAVALAVLVVVAMVSRQTYVLGLFAIFGTAPALVVTLGTQSRYMYFASLLIGLMAAIGASRLFELIDKRLPRGRWATLAVSACVGIVGVQLAVTLQASSSLRAAHNEAQAFLTAVLNDHPSVPDGAPICLLNSGLDASSAAGVFLDPRLGPNVGTPNVSSCVSEAQIPQGVWAYERVPGGTYKKIR